MRLREFAGLGRKRQIVYSPPLSGRKSSISQRSGCPHNGIVSTPRWSSLGRVWYLCISLGFILLGVRAMLLGAPMWTVILRWVIGASFFALALLQRQERRR